MLQDGLTLTDTTVATNFSIQSGTSLPSSGNNVGELFYLTTGNAGLYIYTGTEWIPSTAASEVSFDSLNIKPAVRVMSTINVPAPSGTLTVDGVSLSVGDRVLLTGQASAVNNGVWVVASGAWSRASDFDGSPSNEVKAGDFVFVTEGTTHADTGWVLTTDGTITIDTTPLTFAQFTGGSGSASLSTGYVGFGSATSELTGSANLTWVDGTRTLSVGTAGTSSTVTTVENGSLTIKGGQGSGTQVGGAITIQGGSSQTEGSGGSNQGPALTLRGGSGGGSVGPGGDLILQTTPDFAANYASRLTIKANGSWILNGFAGNVGQALMSNGSSAPPSWQSVSVTGGSTTHVQYNNAGSLAGTANFTYNGGQIVDIGDFSNDGNAVLRVHGLITSGTDGGNSTGLTIRTANRSGAASGLTIGVGTSGGNNPGASITITAGAEGANGYGGGNVTITGGSGYNGVNGYAGNVIIAGGVGSAAQGAVALRTAGINRFIVNGDGSLGLGAGNSVGSAGQVLTSNGTGNAPSWQAVSVSSTANISGGAANQIPYQTGVSTTAFSSNLTFTTGASHQFAVGANSVAPVTFYSGGSLDIRTRDAQYNLSIGPGPITTSNNATTAAADFHGGDNQAGRRAGPALFRGGDASSGSLSEPGDVTLRGGNNNGPLAAGWVYIKGGENAGAGADGAISFWTAGIERLTIGIAGTVTMVGTGGSTRIRADFSSSGLTRTYLTTTTTNGVTNVGLLPNGTATQSQLAVFNTSDATGEYGQFIISGTLVRIDSGGTAPKPIAFSFSNTEAARITTTGAWSFGSSGTATGTAGQVLTSSGSSSAPTWSVAPPRAEA